MHEKIFAIKITAIWISAFLLFSSCSTNHVLTGSPVDDEAREKAEKFWFSQLTKCGDSYYRKMEFKKNGDVVFYEYKEPIVRIAPMPVTEADRMNGIEWHGSISLQAKLSRIWDPYWGRWAQWSNGLGSTRDNAYPMKRVNGQWNINTNRGQIFEETSQYVPVDCSKVPQQ